MNARSQYTAVSKQIEAECIAIGFRKRTSVYFSKEVKSDVLGVLAFPMGMEGGELYVNPSVGVRYQPLEQLVAEMKGEKYHSYLSGTLTCHLGYVPPFRELLWFEFPPTTDSGLIVSRMMSVVRENALPWMERHMDLHSFIEDLGSYDYANRMSVQIRLPAAYYLAGDAELARARLLQGLEEVGDDDELASDQYRKFAQNLLKCLALGSKLKS